MKAERINSILIQEIVDILYTQNSFQLHTHIQPDGDALGSLLALGLALEKIGKTVYYESEGASQLDFLPGYAKIREKKALDNQVDALIYVDCANLERSKISQSRAEQSPNISTPLVINIDHHVSNNYFGDVWWVDPQASSVGEMLYLLIEMMGIAVDHDIATNLYVSIITDTGRFAFSNTTRRTHEIAGRLLETGIEVTPLQRRIFDQKSLAKTKLLARALESLYLAGEGQVAIMSLAYEDFKNLRLDHDSSEGFIQQAMYVEGVQTAALLKEIEPDLLKVSLRSDGQIDVNLLAAQFGGGGHVRASGCTLRMPLPQGTELIQKVILGQREKIQHRAQ